jgi:hypothetical protein
MAVVSGGTTLIDNGALDAAVPSGSLTLLSTQTASNSATIDFTSGIDSTYDKYVFKFINMHPTTDAVKGKFNFSTDGTNFNVTKTTTGFYAGHTEADATGFGFDSALAQSTSDGFLSGGTVGNADDESLVGSFFLFAPSSTTYVKHYISDCNIYGSNPQSQRFFSAGYGNTTSAIVGVRFKFDSGNIDSGVIKLYGIGG